MKKVILSVAVFGALALVSCKKDYTCECTTSDGSTTTGTVSTTITDTKKKATDACEAMSATAGTLSTTCKIK